MKTEVFESPFEWQGFAVGVASVEKLLTPLDVMTKHSQRSGQRLCWMQRATACRMLHLLPARDSGSHNDGFGVLFYSRKQAAPADRDGDVVVFLLISERASHAAATRVDLFHGVGHREGLFQIAGTDERFFVTMSVNERLRLLALEFEFPSAGLFFLHDEFFEEERSPGHIDSVVILDEVRIFIPESEDAARLAPDK